MVELILFYLTGAGIVGLLSYMGQPTDTLPARARVIASALLWPVMVPVWIGVWLIRGEDRPRA